MNLKNKKVFVTGASGFIGSHLVESLMDKNCDVTAFVHYNSFNNWGWLNALSVRKIKELKVISGDIRNIDSVKKAFENIDVVFHLAALVGIPYSYVSPHSYVDTNIKGTFNILEAAGEKGCSKILITSTSEVYGTAKYAPINEEHPLQAQSPYSATKIAADKIAESFYRSFELPVAIVRPFNTYGPRQSARAVIPTIISQLLSGKKEIKIGSLHPSRDFVFVKDTVNGFIEIAESNKTVGEEINIATQKQISIGDLVQKIINIINSSAKVIQDKERKRPQKSEVEKLIGSNEKIKRLTNWKVQYDLDRGLKETIRWFSDVNNLRLYKSEIYNV